MTNTTLYTQRTWDRSVGVGKVPDSYSSEKLNELLNKTKNIKVGFTCGAFDLFHAGHVMMMKEAREQCDFLIVGLHSDPTLDRPEKNKPIQSLEERKIQLEGCKYVDDVWIYDTESELLKLLKLINPDVRIIGADWKDKPFTGHELDIECYYNSRNHNLSSSELRQRIAELENNKE